MPAPSPTSVLGTTLNRFGVDRAVGFAVLSRGWQLVTGPVTQLMVIFLLSAVQQGYYTTFLNLLAMQIFVELGLHVVVINVASHEWAQLRLEQGRIAGNSEAAARLGTLWKGSVKWYGVCAVIFFLAVSAFGYAFFDTTAVDGLNPLPQEEWLPAWLVLVVLTAGQLLLLPSTSLLEGCGQLPVLNRFRFWQGVAGSVAVWVTLVCGFGLWALCVSAAVRLVGETWLVRGRYRSFFDSLRTKESIVGVWKNEVQPLQWRMALQGALLWFASHLAGLVLFNQHGAAAAGRYGMMLTIMTAMQAASLAWIETRRPLFGGLIAERQYDKLDDLFFRMSRISVGLLSAGVIVFAAGVEVASWSSHWFLERISERLPNSSTVLIFGVGLIVMQLAQCTNIYVRAHKKDPFLLAAVVSNVVIGILVFALGYKFEIEGVAWGYSLGITFVQTPLWVGIWYRTRKAWHNGDGLNG